LSGTLGLGDVPGDERGRAAVTVGKLALRHAGIDRSEQVGVVGGRDLRDRLHTDDSSLLERVPSKPDQACHGREAEGERRSRLLTPAHPRAHTPAHTRPAGADSAASSTHTGHAQTSTS
jgi:hypothetical protein